MDGLKRRADGRMGRRAGRRVDGHTDRQKDGRVVKKEEIEIEEE